jgi:phospholipid transport system substrate-binding protein
VPSESDDESRRGPLPSGESRPASAAVVGIPGIRGGPLARLQYANQRISVLLKEPAGDPATRDEIHRIAHDLIDGPSMARKALAGYWDELSETQREDFEATLSALIESRWYIAGLRKVEAVITYTDEVVAGDEATVSTRWSVPGPRRIDEDQIDYKLHRTDGQWRVRDVVTDEVSMMNQYRSQFHRLLVQESFDGLLRKMRNRIQSTD